MTHNFAEIPVPSDLCGVVLQEVEGYALAVQWVRGTPRPTVASSAPLLTVVRAIVEGAVHQDPDVNLVGQSYRLESVSGRPCDARWVSVYCACCLDSLLTGPDCTMQ